MALTGWPETINGEGHVSVTEWSLTWIEAPFHLPHSSLYINQTLFLSFLYFATKIYNQSASVIIVRQYSSCNTFLPSTFNLVSILFPLKFFKHFVSLDFVCFRHPL